MFQYTVTLKEKGVTKTKVYYSSNNNERKLRDFLSKEGVEILKIKVDEKESVE